MEMKEWQIECRTFRNGSVMFGIVYFTVQQSHGLVAIQWWNRIENGGLKPSTCLRNHYHAYSDDTTETESITSYLTLLPICRSVLVKLSLLIGALFGVNHWTPNCKIWPQKIRSITLSLSCAWTELRQQSSVIDSGGLTMRQWRHEPPAPNFWAKKIGPAFRLSSNI